MGKISKRILHSRFSNNHVAKLSLSAILAVSFIMGDVRILGYEWHIPLMFDLEITYLKGTNFPGFRGFGPKTRN